MSNYAFQKHLVTSTERSQFTNHINPKGHHPMIRDRKKHGSDIEHEFQLPSGKRGNWKSTQKWEL